MEKILLVINAQKPNLASIDFACRIVALAQTKLTGLLIENIYDHDPLSGLKGPSYFKAIGQVNSDTLVRTDTEQVMRLFVEECNCNHVSHEVYLDKGEPIQEVIFESRFADLLIIDPDMHFYKEGEQLP